MSLTKTVLFIITLQTIFQLCYGAIFSDVSQLRDNYDFVIVGGGTAGLTVANRLTEEPYNVLVIEAGGNHSHDLNITVPFFCTRASPFTMYDWNYTTVEQKNADNRVINYPRGYLLGGSSSINYMVYTRGTKDDYDRFAALSGDNGWSWDAMQPYFFKNERLTPPADGHNTTGQIDPEVHGKHGINSDSLPGFAFPLDNKILNLTKELDNEFPYNIEPNGPSHLGIGWRVGTTLNGARSSSATSYLAPKYSSRTNFDVLIGARATRILQNKNAHGDNSTFTTVEFISNGEVSRVSASKELILSAGSINTPTILMHSGIGDASELQALGIKTIVNLTSVGKNLTDHPIIRNMWTVNSTDTLEQYTRNATRLAEALQQWEDSRTGVLVGTTANQIGFFRIADIDANEDPAAGPNTGHIEMLYSNGAVGTPPPEGNYMAISTAIVTPSSRGSVTINSSNPLDPPLIDPNFLSAELDRRIIREGIRMTFRVADAPVFNDYIIAPTANITSDSTDDEIDAYVRNITATVYHPVGTAAMSARVSDYGVVDPDLKVKGLAGLRIVDASVFPRIPAGHTQVPVYVFAERASDLIKQTWVRTKVEREDRRGL